VVPRKGLFAGERARSYNRRDAETPMIETQPLDDGLGLLGWLYEPAKRIDHFARFGTGISKPLCVVLRLRAERRPRLPPPVRPCGLSGGIRPPHHRVRPPSESLGAGGRRQKAKRHSGFPDGAVKRLSHGQVEPRTIEVGSNVKWVSLNEETIPDVDPRLHRGTDPDGKRHACA
jgi:hypothetical protein